MGEKRSRYEKQAILSDWQRDHGGLRTSIMTDRQALLKGALDAAHEHIRSTPPAVPLWGFTPRLRPPPVFERPPPHVSAVNHEVEVLRQASLGIQERSRYLEAQHARLSPCGSHIHHPPLRVLRHSEFEMCGDRAG